MQELDKKASAFKFDLDKTSLKSDCNGSQFPVRDELENVKEIFLKDLIMIQEVFLDPMVELDIMPKEMIASLFSKFEELPSVSDYYLEELKQMFQKSMRNKLEKTHVKEMDLYHRYLSYRESQPRAIRTVYTFALMYPELKEQTQGFLKEARSKWFKHLAALTGIDYRPKMDSSDSENSIEHNDSAKKKNVQKKTKQITRHNPAS